MDMVAINENSIESIKKLSKLLKAAKQAQNNGKQRALSAILDKSYEISEKMQDREYAVNASGLSRNNQFYVRVIGELMAED